MEPIIKQFYIENFKAIKRGKWFDFNNLSVLTGANSSVKSILFNELIPSTDNGGHPGDEDNIQSAERMISVIEKWIAGNNEDLNIYLVDRIDGFAPLIKNQ